ncbi:glycosyltransferase [Curtobacterium sp. ODYSSEY 48 V2]|uniref:glycosyltransferase n=1 Tax=Curtobacterium sp. ODYSSEY 48 V2 TaxID=2939561 RepID=UPI0035A8D1FB
MNIVQTVTLVSRNGAFGGPLAVAVTQCRELARRGHRVTLLAAWDGELRLNIPGVRVVLSRGGRIPGAGFSGVHAPSLIKWLADHRSEVDVVHVHAGRHALDLQLASRARTLGIPFVMQTHGMIMPAGGPIARILDLALTRPLLRAATAVLVLTDRETSGIRDIEPAARVHTVRNGLAASARPAERVSLSPEVLFLARLHPRKRVLAFAEMALILHAKGVDAKFTVIGPDEGDLTELQRLCADHPAVPISYEGSVEPGKGASRIAESEVYVLPSHGEVFPVTVLEALSAGSAVVLTEDCGIAQRLSDLDAASTSSGTPADLASCVEELLRDTATRERRARNGRALIDSEFGARMMVDEIERLYPAHVPSSGQRSPRDLRLPAQGGTSERSSHHDTIQ